MESPNKLSACVDDGIGLHRPRKPQIFRARKAAPIEYVRICDAYGSWGFFYIPGNRTCRGVGGLVMGEYRAYTRVVPWPALSPGAADGPTTMLPAIVKAGGADSYRPQINMEIPPADLTRVSSGRDASKLDARTATPYRRAPAPSRASSCSSAPKVMRGDRLHVRQRKFSRRSGYNNKQGVLRHRA